MNIASLIARNQARWDAMVLDPARLPGLRRDAARCVALKPLFLAIEAATKVPWWAAVTWFLRESDLDLTKQFAQGDPLDSVSVNVPRGQGPYRDHPDDKVVAIDGEAVRLGAFYRSALVGLVDDAPNAAKWTDWSEGGYCTITIEFNGEGYENRGKASPYAFAGTNQYTRGKYVGDGRYDPNVVDTQPGCAAVLKCMIEIDPTIRFGAPALPAPTPVAHTAPDPATTDKPLWQLLVEAIEKEITMPAFLLPLLLSVATNPSIDASIEQMIAGLLAGIGNAPNTPPAVKAVIQDVSNSIPDIVTAVITGTVAAAAPVAPSARAPVAPAVAAAPPATAAATANQKL
jgi:lysozyme family protein